MERQSDGVHGGRIISYGSWALWVGIQLEHLDEGGAEFIHGEELPVRPAREVRIGTTWIGTGLAAVERGRGV
jgi:hypothetical protein